MATDTDNVLDRQAATKRIYDITQMEAQERMLESRIQTLATKGLGDEAQKSQSELKDLQGRLEDLRATPVARDLEGTAAGLSDKAGNFAPNAEVAAAGGIGVELSNTNAETGEQAQTADEAGVPGPASTPLIVGLGGQPEPLPENVDEGSEAEGGEVGASSRKSKRRRSR